MKGHKRIAGLMGKYPSLGMVSQFSSLNIQSLLYQQAELIGLQQDLHELEIVNDSSPDPGKASFSKNWLALSEAKEDDGSDEQWKLVLSIREKLKEYNEAVVLYSEMAALNRPNSRDLSILQVWMQRPSMGSVFLVGRDRNVWSHGEDLIALKGRGKDNQLSAWLGDTLTPLYHHAFGKYHRKPDTEVAAFAPNTVHYSDHSILRVSSFLGTIVASLLPVSAIMVLYFITAMGTRLGLVGTFTAVFSICLWFMTDGRLIDSATSAFSAVQVVFISTNITSAG